MPENLRLPLGLERSQGAFWPNYSQNLCRFKVGMLAAVGTPVTRRPPHRPGRAAFPHPVPRLYSLPRRSRSSPVNILSAIIHPPRCRAISASDTPFTAIPDSLLPPARMLRYTSKKILSRTLLQSEAGTKCLSRRPPAGHSCVLSAHLCYVCPGIFHEEGKWFLVDSLFS